MPQIAHLRRWFALGAVLMCTLVCGMYFYARLRVQNALKQIPEKMGVNIEQTSNGFTISKSEQGRTLFKVQASKAVQFKEGGHAELHDVTITLYGKDSSRFDRIYGKNFQYNPKTGDVTGEGRVDIDLQSNPQGAIEPDQAAPKAAEKVIRLSTTALKFNQRTGDAHTDQKVDFDLPQANGSAVGVTYVAKTNVLTMQSQVNLFLRGATPATITALHGVITRDPHQVVLDHPHLAIKQGKEWADAEKATLYLRPDNTLDHVIAENSVRLAADSAQPARAQCDQFNLLMQPGRGVISTATLTGHVQMNLIGQQPLQENSDAAVLYFSGANVLTKIHAEKNVRLLQHQATGNEKSAQDMELTAPVVDFIVINGDRLNYAETNGPPQIALRAVPPNPSGRQTVVTAAKFEAHFDDQGQISSVHGAPDARIVATAPNEPQRASTSSVVDAAFGSGSGINKLVQEGNVYYLDDERKAWADHATYTPGDQMLVLTGSPRVVDNGTTTTASVMRLNRGAEEAFADGNVHSTYSDLQPQPDGALLATSSPIHVSSRSMSARGTPAIATYTGGARLWQDDNLVEAPSIQFDRDHRYVLAEAWAGRGVSTVLTETDSKGNVTSVTVTSDKLSYSDPERKAHFTGHVVAEGGDMKVTAKEVEAYFKPRGGVSTTSKSDAAQNNSTTATLDTIVATDDVVITEPERKGTGNKLVYTAATDKFVLTGGPPSIFDAERGKITGDSLTFYKRDDRVEVEGSRSSPAVTETRVAR